MRWSLALLFGFLPLAFLGCDGSGPPVRFVLPQGFHGVFQIAEDTRHGVDLVKSNGMLLVVVPTNGCVVVKDRSFLTVWHKESAIFPDGNLISEEHHDTNGLALHGMFSEGHTNWILVGTLHEAGIAHKIQGIPMPLARPLTENDMPSWVRKK